MKTLIIALLMTSLGSSKEVRACDGPQFKTVQEARVAELKCQRIADKQKRIECLEGISDWWYHGGPGDLNYNPFLEMTRIMSIELSINPWLIDTLSNLSFYTFSIEVDELLSKIRSDFSDATIRAYSAYEGFHNKNFYFYVTMAPTLMYIIDHKQFGSLETKKMYYQEFKRLVLKTHELYPLIKPKMNAEMQRRAEAQMSSLQKFLVKHQELDVAGN